MSQDKQPLFKIKTSWGNKEEEPEQPVEEVKEEKEEITFRNDISNAEIEAVIEEGKAKYRKGRIAFTVGIIMVIISFLMVSFTKVLFMIGGAIIAAIGFAMKHSAKQDVKMEAGIHVIHAALEEVFDNVQYYPEKAGPTELFSTPMGFPFSYNRVESDDYIEAVYHGLKVQMSDTHLIDVTTSTDEDGNEHENCTTVFKGPWMVCDFGKELSADMIIAEGQGSKKRSIKTDNERFSKRFGVYSENPQEVFYILTPHMMEYIMEMDRRGEGDTYMRFTREGKLYLAINTDHGMFEVDSFKMTADEMREKFIGEVRYLTDLIDELRISDSIYKK